MEYIAWIRTDHGHYFQVDDRIVCGADRKDAISNANRLLAHNENLNGVSLIPADEWYKLNDQTKNRWKEKV
jgi:hypothetical protein